MNFNTIKECVNKTQAGAFRNMVWEHEIPLKSAYKSHLLTKRSEGVVRFGVRYDNIKSVQEKRESGELPEKNAGLVWGEWMDNNFITHKGKTYLRCAESNGNKVHVQYYLDGRKVALEDIKDIALKSAVTPHGDMDVFTINTDNIISIR